MKSIFIKFNFILTLAVALLATTINAQSIVQRGEILALTNATVIDGIGGRPKPNMTLVVSGERITEMSPTGKKRLPAGATVMDLSGQYIMPGLIDSHYHLIPYDKVEEEMIARFALLGGITGVRDMAGDGISLAELAKAARDNNVQSPRIYFSALMAGST
ncbi:MAG: hypothetical protein M3388_08080 [Acidobacteriota bacterium]|nr:hypothetical protein [Acidobacteriota bacterium]